MKIAYSGILFTDGLRQIGATVFDFTLDASRSLEECVLEVCKKPDLIIIDFFAFMQLPHSLYACPFPTLVYAFDSIINLHTYKHLLHAFDYVFVDHKKSVKELEQNGIKAHYLPLCINQQDIREHAKDDTYYFSFVGRITKFREKRKNLLNYIQENHAIEVFSELSFQEMQDVYAHSTLTLNENLFNGISLRVFQALATGTLLLNEDNIENLDEIFTNMEHLVLYNHATIDEILNDIKGNPEKYKKIAKNGQNLCIEEHTSWQRAQSIFQTILQTTYFPDNFDKLSNSLYELLLGKLRLALNKRLRNIESHASLYNEICYKYNYARSYGGAFADCIDKAKEIIAANTKLSPYACAFLGDISLRAKNFTNAEQYYFQALQILADPNIMQEQGLQKHLELFVFLHCKLIMCKILLKNFSTLHADNKILIDIFSRNTKINLESIEIACNFNEIEKVQVKIYYTIAQIYAYFTKEVELGFTKDYQENLPENALDYALMAWELSANSRILDFILNITEKFHLTGEYLDIFLPLLEKDTLTKAQKDIIIYNAKAYYLKDFLSNNF